jgi:hypothetical protein
MSISSAICADYANKKKEGWTEKFRNVFRGINDPDEVVRQMLKVVKEMEDFEFVE